MSRTLLIALFLSLLTLSLGCKGCQKDPCDDVVCLGGEVCEEGVCVVDTIPCDPGCEEGEICQGGQCVSLDPQCEAIEEECDPSLPVNEGFLCLDFDGLGPRPGTCVPPCAADGTCDFGALCFFVAGAMDEVCTTIGDCPEGTECADGACRQTICRPSECDGFVDGVQTCDDLYSNVSGFESGSQCYAVGNGAQYCYPAGTRGEGEACTDPIDAIIAQQFDSTCESGLACVDSTCRVACEDDDRCGVEQECILADRDLVGPGVGVCGSSCTPFEVGTCGAGRTCLPVSGDEGVCVEAGDAPAFDSCSPGAGDCEDGTICVTYQESSQTVARCQPICDVTVAPPNDNGSVGDFAQSQRDATCPQPERVDAWLSVVNLAELGAAVDVYLGDGMTPTVSGLALDERTDDDAATVGDQWLSVEPGNYAVKILLAGAPTTDPPLVEGNLTLSQDQAAELVLLPVVDTTDELSLLELEGLRGVAAPPDGVSAVRLLHGLVDAGVVDVVVVPPMDDLSDPANQTELGTDIAVQAVTEFVEVPAGDHDLLVYPVGDPRTERTTALLDTNITLTAGSNSTLALRGTVDADDTPLAGAALFEVVEAPAVGSGGFTFTCVDAGNQVFGFCQQNCGPGSSGYAADFCEGAKMACHPSFLDVNGIWKNLCAPQGDLALGDPCNPFNEYAGCGEGLYCLEYGNTIADFDPVLRGRCVSHCVEDAPDDPVLSCADGQACQAVAFDPSFAIGQCGFACEPNRDYEDADCPQGLRSCKPRASLNDDPANPDAYPTTSEEQAFCSASGDVASGEQCGGNDCIPGSECMFPRSEQATFTSTLLSQYFGASGLAPFCAPQCDPFDNNSSNATCAADETCLFNFPWSAEVGHCTPIVEDREPLEGCTQPGLACGRDSICAINAGTASCFQFCQYAGPDTAGMLQPETCKPGFLCAPLVADIGVCLSP